MFSRPEEDCGAAGARRLLDEIRDAVAKRVDLQRQPDVEILRSRSSISRSRIGSQLRLRAKLSSVMKNRVMFCAALARTMASTSSGVR